ncbi:hypothetical protein [Ancylomarina longa]|uniref:Uncharacterized protein n=1 Tax=Ancylomarina longa TaxID=2487017 RepID=A0A434AEL1_9BACT|nr:hypothetical protein [Ancylomarina longa]RUT72824.1 hypothetical protein DLK05_16545 [Ancylomarina longa]
MKKNTFKKQSVNVEFYISDLQNKDLKDINGGGILWYLLGYAMGTINKVGNDTGSQLMLFQ